MAKLPKIEGIGKAYARSLQKSDVGSTRSLLRKGATSEGRKAIARESGISSKLILKWINHADLFRIKGVGAEYADLLEAAGVDTVPELAQRIARNLHMQMTAVNEKKKLVRKLPTQSQVADWIKQAKRLPRVINY